MDTPILEYVVTRLRERRGYWPTIAEEAGISLRTLEKIARGETKDPRIGNVQALYDYLRQHGQAA
jgi:hypothetical protein